MKRKVLFSALAIMIIAAAFGAGTMAWFTAKSEAPESEFVAGTVMIEASAAMIFGVERVTGDIYEIDVLAGEKYLIFNQTNQGQGGHVNALAYDLKNQRLYYNAPTGNTLYFYDFNSESPAGVLASSNGSAGAAFGNGYYWYVPRNSNDLRRVSFNPDGTIAEDMLFLQEFAGKNLSFGDIAMDIRNNIIYGSAARDGTPNSQNPADRLFFAINLLTGDYQRIDEADGSPHHLQLAFGADGKLYGHASGGTANKSLGVDNGWYVIDVESNNGGYSYAIGNQGEPLWIGTRSFNDLASNFQSNWNPGDCDRVYYRITSNGSKDIRLRMYLEGQWDFDQGWVDENWDALCFSGEVKPASEEEWNNFFYALSDPVTFGFCDGNDDWELVGDYYYYVGQMNPVKPGDQVEVCLSVCLTGGATNHFQGATYSLKGYFEAIQASNGAPLAEWEVTLFQAAP